MIPILLAGVAALTLWAGGYLFGAKRGHAARNALRALVDQGTETIRKTEGAAQSSIAAEREQLASLRAELEALRESERSAKARAEHLAHERKIAEAENSRNIGALRSALAASESAQQALRERLEELLGPIAKQETELKLRHAELERRINDRLEAQGDVLLKRLVSEAIGPLQERTGALRKAVADAMRPLQEDERVITELSKLEAGNDRGDLNRLLSAIAEQAGFALVTLSDASGLLLANSTAGARNAELRAGLSALVLTIVNSSEQMGAPKPLSVSLLDTENQMVVTRVFEVDGEHFLLTAVSKGRMVPPNVLDPALSKVETLMEDWAAAQLLPAAAHEGD